MKYLTAAEEEVEVVSVEVRWRIRKTKSGTYNDDGGYSDDVDDDYEEADDDDDSSDDDDDAFLSSR